jgi:hypothetical protein
MALFSYEDVRGNQHIGRMERYIDLCGTDHTAAMRLASYRWLAAWHAADDRESR